MTQSLLCLAGCVITDNEGKILLLHRNKNGIVHWELPGGKIDDGEDASETAVREIKEELCVDVTIVRLLGGANFVFEDTTCQYQWFLARILKGSPAIGEPQTFDDMKYVAMEDMDDLVLSANMQNLVSSLNTGAILLDK